MNENNASSGAGAEAQILKQAFDKIITNKFTHAVAPEPYMTKFGIRHFDAILGGGFSSSMPLMFSAK